MFSFLYCLKILHNKFSAYNGIITISTFKISREIEKILNLKSLYVAAIAILVILGGIIYDRTYSGTVGTQNSSDNPNVLKVKPLEVELQTLSVEKISERARFN